MTALLPGTAREARRYAEQWLAHLKRDPRGLPVPWINAWGPETAQTTRIDYDPWARSFAVFLDDHGDEPDFRRQNMGRQRQAMIAGLCQVCAREVPWSRRNLVISSISVRTVDVTGSGRMTVVSEPWLDDRCAAIATQLCPALIRRRDTDDLIVYRVTSPRQAQLAISTGILDPERLVAQSGGTEQARAAADRLVEQSATYGNLAMWAKVHLLRPQ